MLHARANARNAENLCFRRTVEVDAHIYLMSHTCQLLIFHLLADFSFQLRESDLGAVLLEFVEHAIPDAGDQKDLLIRHIIEVDRDP